VTLDASQFSRRWTVHGEDMEDLAPVVAASGLVYTSGTVHPVGTTANTLWAFDEADGTVKWSVSLPIDAHVDPPAVSDSRVFVTSRDNSSNLYAFDAVSGAPLYQQAAQHGASQPWSRGFALAPWDGSLYTGLATDGGVVSHDATTGAARWTVVLREEVDPGLQSWTPAVNDDLVFTNVLGVFNAFDRTDGSTVFSVDVPGLTGGTGGGLIPIWYALNQAPVIVDSGSVVMLDFRNADGLPEDNHLTMVDLQEQRVRWTLPGRFTAHPVAGGGAVYVANHAAQQVEARSPATGEVLWSWQPDIDEEAVFNSLLLTDNLLFVSAAGKTHAIDLASRQTVWTYPVAGALSLSANGILYIVTENDGGSLRWLVAINVH